MSAFTRTTATAANLCVGAPDCQAGHNHLLHELTRRTTHFLSHSDTVTNATRGNLGEFIAFTVCNDLAFSEFRAFPVNAFNPLGGISRSEIDIVWLHFGPDASADLALIQEIKTTGDPNLSYADRLLDDYDKLFADDDPAVTLLSRLQGLKSVVEHSLKLPELVPRVSALAGASPASCSRIRLVPTIVHEKVNSQPDVKLSAIRAALVSRGWSNATIDSWSVALSELNDRLERLARGQS